MKNEILLRRKNKVVLPESKGSVRLELIKIASKNLESLGYKFSKRLISALKNQSFDQLSNFYKDTVSTIRKQLGAHVDYKPFYPGFPDQVRDSSQIELYFNAFIHYATNVLPKFDTPSKFPLFEETEVKEIDLGDESELGQIFANLVNAKGSWSSVDKEDIDTFIQIYQNTLLKLIPNEIHSKENASFLLALIYSKGLADFGFISKYLKTATDVLRFSVALSGGNVSLAENTKFRNFKRQERRLILKLLNDIGNIEEDMMRFQGQWIRLGERLHPYEYGNMFPKAARGFKVVRDNLDVITFNSQLERFLLNKDIGSVLELLISRPGEFARRLDLLLRTTKEHSQILEKFKYVSNKVSTPVLLQNLAHFKNRKDMGTLRVFFPKGEVSKAYSIENRLTDISKKSIDKLINIIISELLKRFSQLPSLGKVFIDQKLKKFTIPLAQRSASKSLRTIPRGSRVELPEGSTVRFFLWWKEGFVGSEHTGRVDIDLSSVMYDSDWKYITHISWTNLKGFSAYHSGDIVTAPEGACEFIDLDIDSMLKLGGQYIVMSINAFTPHPYCDLPECFAGWMMRKHPNSGEIFEPRTVQDRIDLAANTRICIPVIIDLLNREMIWTDLALTKHPRWFNTVENNNGGMSLMGKAMTSLVKPNLYDLFDIHARARGQLVEDPQKAETIFAMNKGITPFDISTILAQFVK